MDASNARSTSSMPGATTIRPSSCASSSTPAKPGRLASDRSTRAVPPGVRLDRLHEHLLGAAAVHLEVDEVGLADPVEDVDELTGIKADRARVDGVAVYDGRQAPPAHRAAGPVAEAVAGGGGRAKMSGIRHYGKGRTRSCSNRSGY